MTDRDPTPSGRRARLRYRLRLAALAERVMIDDEQDTRAPSGECAPFARAPSGECGSQRQRPTGRACHPHEVNR